MDSPLLVSQVKEVRRRPDGPAHLAAGGCTHHFLHEELQPWRLHLPPTQQLPEAQSVRTARPMHSARCALSADQT